MTVSNTLLDRRGRLLPVAEVFGPTIQGEGAYSGHRAMFARLGLCNLACAWCDTPYTWDRTRYDLAAECPDTDAAELADRLLHPPNVPAGVAPPVLVVLTGGEPLIHQSTDGWRYLVETLYQAGRVIHVETNGTLAPSALTESRVTHFTVSPKLAHAGDPSGRRLRPSALETFARLAATGDAAFKFVVAAPADLDEVDAITTAYQVPANTVWIMPEGQYPGHVLARQLDLADAVIARGWNLTTRLHTLLWGPERGR